MLFEHAEAQKGGAKGAMRNRGKGGGGGRRGGGSQHADEEDEGKTGEKNQEIRQSLSNKVLVYLITMTTASRGHA